MSKYHSVGKPISGSEKTPSCDFRKSRHCVLVFLQKMFASRGFTRTSLENIQRSANHYSRPFELRVTFASGL